jgi:putative Mg2+ transporter-C (MgtC) family protein
MVVSAYGFEGAMHTPEHRWDVSRVAAQVVSGIGFIGAGTIIFQKHVVRGLTTAAGLWVTAAIGMTCGAGLYLLAGAATVLVMLCLETLNWLMKRFGTRNVSITFSSPTLSEVTQVLERLRNDGMSIDSYNMRETKSEGKIAYTVTLDVIVKRNKYESRVMGIMEELNGVRVESIE